MAHQEALTVVAPVVPERMARLEALLESMRPEPGRHPLLPFSAVATCHFGRLVALPAITDVDRRPLGPKLLLIVDCDGAARECLRQLVLAAAAGMDELFGHCVGYPVLGGRSADHQTRERLAYLQAHQLPIKANYVHRPGRTVQQIHREAQLYAELQGYLDGQDLQALSAADVRRQLQHFVASAPALRWALAPAEGVDLGRKARDAVDLLARPLAAVALGPVVLPAIVVVLLLIRLQELRDRPPHERPSAEHVRRLAELEDLCAHNGFTVAGLVKPGLVRQAAIRLVLPLIGYGTRHLFTRGSLAGVRTIHFARWIPLDGGRRVVFASNYDGSLESYNNDFIDLVSWGLNLVFSNGLGYPPTRWMVFGGARYEQPFKDLLRQRQLPTPVWYSAYPHLSALNVDRNAKVRAGLSGTMNEEEAQRWLRLL